MHTHETGIELMRAESWNTRISLLLVVAAISGCTALPLSQQPASLPPSVYGVYLDNDTGAINYAAWAFASADNLRNNPIAAAKALIALEYLPGQFRTNPRWIGIDSAIALHLDRARMRFRQVLAIQPAASNQMVIGALLAVANTLQSLNPQGVGQALQSPVFTLPPANTLAELSNLPYDEEANLATSRALGQSTFVGGVRG
jgi:hypothetical protein